MSCLYYTVPELERKSDPVEESTREDATGTAGRLGSDCMLVMARVTTPLSLPVS